MLLFCAMNTPISWLLSAFAAGALLAAGPAAADAAADPNAAASAFFERALDERLLLEPTTATSLGLRTGYDRWPDASEAGDSERLALSERHLAALKKIDPAKLDAATQLSWKVFEVGEERRIARYRWRNHGYLFDKDGGHVSVPAFLINTHRIDSEADATAYVRRLEGIRPLFAQQLERATAAAKQGIAPPRFVYRYVIEDAGNIIKGRPFDASSDDSPLLADFRGKVGKLAIEESEARIAHRTGRACPARHPSSRPSRLSLPGRGRPRRPRPKTPASGSFRTASSTTTSCCRTSRRPI